MEPGERGGAAVEGKLRVAERQFGCSVVRSFGRSLMVVVSWSCCCDFDFPLVVCFWVGSERSCLRSSIKRISCAPYLLSFGFYRPTRLSP